MIIKQIGHYVITVYLAWHRAVEQTCCPADNVPLYSVAMMPDFDIVMVTNGWSIAMQWQPELCQKPVLRPEEDLTDIVRTRAEC